MEAMVKRKFVIGVDSSTTACKTIAWDKEGNAIGEGRCAIPLSQPRLGWYEQDAEHWWDCLVSSLSELGKSVDLRDAEAVCITHQRETFVPVDKHCRALRKAITWMDERGIAQLSKISLEVGKERFHRITGKPLSVTVSLPKLMWLHDHEPEVLERAHKVLDVHGFLVYRLSGLYRTSSGSADPLGLLDIQAMDWSDELVTLAGLSRDQLCEIVPVGREIGRVSREASQITGLPEGLPIISGIGDGQAAGVGAGVLSKGSAYLNLGTCVVSGVFCEQYTVSSSFRTMGGPLLQTYYLEHALRSGVFTVNWFVDRFAPDLRQVFVSLIPEEILESAAHKLPPGSQGLMVVPYWSGVMDPYWDPCAVGVVVGWHGIHSREHFYKAILEGIAFEQKLAQESIAESLGYLPEQYVVLGGGSKSDLWCQIIADVTGVPLVRSGTPEATNLGAGIIAAVSCGWYSDLHAAADVMSKEGRKFEPILDNVEIYSELYQIYRSLFPLLRSQLDKLSSLRGDSRGVQNNLCSM